MQTSQELLADAIRLGNDNNVTDATLAFTEVVKRYDKSTDPAVRENVAEALLNIGVLFKLTGYTEPAVTVLDRVIKEYQGFSVFYLSALYNKAGALMTLGQSAEAVATYEEMVNQADSYRGDDPTVLDCVAGALINLGVIYGRSNSIEKATRHSTTQLGASQNTRARRCRTAPHKRCITRRWCCATPGATPMRPHLQQRRRTVCRCTCGRTTPLGGYGPVQQYDTPGQARRG